MKSRRALAALISLMMLSGAAACTQASKERLNVLRFIDTTERLTRDFIYTHKGVSGPRVVIEGKVEDGLRFEEVLRIGQTDLMDQIVDDDAVALRLMAADSLPGLATAVNPTVAGSLRQGQWVIDPSGAPSFRKPSVDSTNDEIGKDPLRDAIDYLNYVRSAVNVAADVKIYQSEDIDPAYKVIEDHFPKPKVKQGERRYDLIRPGLPRFSGAQSAGGGQANSAQIQNFRKMAIFVKNGVIEKILEEIDVVGHKDFVEARRSKQKYLLQLESRILKGQTQNKIHPRVTSMIFKNVGTRLVVRKPEAGLIASLRELFGAPDQAGAFRLTGLSANPQSPEPGGSGPDTGSPADPAASSSPPAQAAGEANPSP
ncbi:MAG: hypothetical protein ABR507_04205 [Actinomycetota bacterium]|nr:hypothetical protein [Actinomycetota bacterium]